MKKKQTRVTIHRS